MPTRWCGPMLVDITVPDLGLDPAAPVTLNLWLAGEGEAVFEGDTLVELLVAGATFDISSPANGVLTEVLVATKTFVRTGQVLARVECGSSP